MSFDLGQLEQAIHTHGRVARVVIASHQGSSPRAAGASMLVWRGGQSGTIGGGALEQDAAQMALSSANVRRIPLGPALGQCCGGAVTLVTEIFEAPPELSGAFVRRVEGEKPMPYSVKRAHSNIRNGTGSDLVFEGGWLAEAVQPTKTPLWIWGAGHVGRAIVRTVAPLDQFDITWVDSAPDRFPETCDDQIKLRPAASMPDAVQLAPKDAHHLILTYSHAFDLEICHRLILRGFASAGLIGSATKWARFQKRLGALGHDSAHISRICCPIGHPALGKHPQAIAVGVVSELIMAQEMQGHVEAERSAKRGKVSRLER